LAGKKKRKIVFSSKMWNRSFSKCVKFFLPHSF
jgi:hypothetical protein